jgi:hypothetical protein
MYGIRPEYATKAVLERVDYTLPSADVVDKEFFDLIAKSKLNVSDYPLIAQFIRTATYESEKQTGQAYINRTITAVFSYVYNKVNLPMIPHGVVSEVKAVNPYDGTETVLTSEQYDVIGGTRKYILVKGFAGYRLEVTYQAGYADNAVSLPEWIKDSVSARVLAKYVKQPEELGLYIARYRMAEEVNKYYYTP